MFTLAEELLLLALEDGKGTVISSAAATLPFGLAGAILAELILRDRIQPDRNDRLSVEDASSTGDDILNDALAQLGRSKEEKSLGYWVSALTYSIPDLEDRLLSRLVEKGILANEEYPHSTGLPLCHPWVQNSNIKQETRQYLRSVALDGTAPIARTTVLLSLTEACHLIGEILSPEERRHAKNRLQEVIGDEAVGKIVSDAVFKTTSRAGAAIIALAAAAG
jgi:golgi phosphoprotein 3